MTLIEINPNGPDEPERKLGKPIEEMAIAIDAADVAWIKRHFSKSFTDPGPAIQTPASLLARAALTILRRHGWITSDCIDAIHAEEDDNGEARSSIIGGGK